MKKSKLILVVIFVALFAVALITTGVFFFIGRNSVKYKKVEFVQTMLPYEGSTVVVNESHNFLFYSTANDLLIEDVLVYDGEKEIERNTIAKKDKTYTYVVKFCGYSDNLSELIDENTVFVTNTGDGVLPGTVEIDGDSGVFKYDYKVKSKKDALETVSVSFVTDDVEFQNILVNKNLSFLAPELIFTSGNLEIEEYAERSKLDYAGIKVNGKKQGVKDPIKLDKDATVEYYYKKDDRKSIDSVDIKTNFNDKFKAGTSIKDLKVVNDLPENVEVEFEYFEAEKTVFDDEVKEEKTLKNKKYRIHGYLDYNDIDKTISSDLKVTVDGEEVKNYYITKQFDSSTLYFYFEKEIKK